MTGSSVPARPSAAGLAGLEGFAVLPRSFFDRPVLSVAPTLLGCVLVHRSSAGMVAAELVETEAYLGESDPASHAFRGQTARNAVMFGPPGHAYVYFTYGMHFCVNLVCQGPGQAAAVLLRAARVIEGAGLAASRRGPAARASTGARDLARGPARLCQALAIAREQNGADVCDQDGSLQVLGRVGLAAGNGQTAGNWQAAGPCQASGREISSGPRVGVRLGAEQPWRFWLAGEPAVSTYRPHVPKRRLPRTGVPNR